MIRLIGLYSPAPQSGKTSIASYLNSRGYRVVSFAAPVKAVVHSFLGSAGFSYAQLDQILAAGKEQVIPELGVTLRHLYQTLGTEWGRTCVGPDVWMNCWRANATNYLSRGIPVVCDDVRFPNEAALIRQLGGEVWCLTRPGASHEGDHASEGALEEGPFDRHFVNNSTLTNLYRVVGEVLDETLGVHAS